MPVLPRIPVGTRLTGGEGPSHLQGGDAGLVFHRQGETRLTPLPPKPSSPCYPVPMALPCRVPDSACVVPALGTEIRSCLAKNLEAHPALRFPQGG